MIVAVLMAMMPVIPGPTTTAISVSVCSLARMTTALGFTMLATIAVHAMS